MRQEVQYRQMYLLSKRKRNGDLETAILNNEAYIKSETLTDLLVFVDELESGIAIEFDEIITRIAINK